MEIVYLLEDSELSGRARNVIAQADALVARGHHVRIVTTGLPVTWTTSRAEWVYVDDVRQFAAARDAVIIDAARSDVVRDELIVDDGFFRDRAPRENEPLRVLLCGAWQNEEKGIDDGYGAVAHARWFHQTLELIRASPWAPSREEPLDSVQEFHVALTTREMTRLMHSCDVLVAAGHREDPLALTTAEALASGLACLLTSTPAHESIASDFDYAAFAPERNAVEIGEKLIELLSDRELRDRLRARGKAVAGRWRAARVAESLENALAKGRTDSS